MKIVQIIPMLTLAGAETMCENLSIALSQLGHEVIVVSLYSGYESPILERLKKAGIRIYFLNKHRGFDFSTIKQLTLLLKEQKPDVVHTHIYASKYGIIAARKAKINKIVHTVHSIATKELSKVSRIFNKWFYKHNLVIPVSLNKIVQDSIAIEYKLKKETIPIVFNGVDLSKCIIKSSYSIKDTFKILHIGRFAEVKNHIGLVNAFEIFHQKHPDSELLLIGDGELKSAIIDLVKRKKLSDSVKFLGLQDNVFEHLNRADIFTLTSNYEGMPMTLIEAMGTGLPIVATSVGGIPDILNNDYSQLVNVDSSLIANAFEKYYLDETLREKHGLLARKSAERFSSLKMAEEYLKIYTKN